MKIPGENNIIDLYFMEEAALEDNVAFDVHCRIAPEGTLDDLISLINKINDALNIPEYTAALS